MKIGEGMFGTKMIYQNSDFEAIKILESFLPNKIFDAHAHVFDTKFAPGLKTAANGDLCLGFSEYQSEMAKVLCRPKDLRANLIIFPDSSMANKKTGNLESSDLNKNSNNVGEIIVIPNQSAEDLEKRLVHPNIRGLKCYHVMANREKTWDADIGEYLPESAWEIANKHKMVITLHMVKDHALADEKNLKYIREMSKKYPDAVLILAHAARAFASWTGVETVEKVADIENVWFDFSTVCESPAMLQIVKKAGIGRCMWGSDYPVCRARGKVISLADSFYWIYQKDLDSFSSKTTLKSWLIATENLMATRQAAILAQLKETEIEDLFYSNAAKLFDRR